MSGNINPKEISDTGDRKDGQHSKPNLGVDVLKALLNSIAPEMKMQRPGPCQNYPY